jgi:hypothetical protein
MLRCSLVVEGSLNTICVIHRYPPYTDTALSIFRFAMALPYTQPRLTWCFVKSATLWVASVAAATAAVVHFWGDKF